MPLAAVAAVALLALPAAAVEEETPDAHTHMYDAGVVTQPATCQAEGVMSFTCVCGHSYEEAIPLLTEHVYDDYTSTETHHSQSCIYCDDVKQEPHQWGESVETKAPTCTKTGTSVKQCNTCQYELTESVPKLEHSYGAWKKVDDTYHKHTCSCGKSVQEKHTWDEGEITTEAGCGNIGIKTYHCTECTAKKTSEIAMLKHTYDNDCDLTCNVCGSIRRASHKYQTKWSTNETEHWHECTVCHDRGDLAAHTPTDWVVDVPPGEYTPGQRHNNCVDCGILLVTEEIPETGCLHGNEELLGVVEVSCTQEGYTGDWTCPRCHEVVIYGEAIPMLPHNTLLENAKEPTCTEEGYTGDMICQDCRHTEIPGEAIPMLPHNTLMENAKEPTCTEEGYTGDMICQDCRHTEIPGEVIPMLAHQTKLQGKRQAYCDEEGYTGDLVCEVCQRTVEQGQAIPRADHRYEDGICLDCEQKDPTYVPPTTPEADLQVEAPTMNPIVVVCIVVLCVTGVGIVVLTILLIKKK